MGTIQAPVQRPEPLWGLAVLGLAVLAVGGLLAGYALIHRPTGEALFTLGFSGMLPMKAWLTTGAAALALVQVMSALAMWGRLPGVRSPASWVSVLHRWSGTTAFVLTLPVAFHCAWSMGFATQDVRTLSHSVLGCLFYGIFAAKMLSLRMPNLPSFAVPLLGGLLATVVTALWFTASLWYFTQPTPPLY